MSNSERLKPCPFCGGRAEIIEIDEGENEGGSCVCCTVCQASSNVEFEFKENFRSNWNRRSETTQGDGSGGDVVDEVIIAPDVLQDLIQAAYEKGAHDVHAHYQPDPDPDFKEAAWDYVASLDFTTTTRPCRSETTQGDGSGGDVERLREALIRIQPHTRWPSRNGTLYDARTRLDHIGTIAEAALQSAPAPALGGEAEDSSSRDRALSDVDHDGIEGERA